MNKYLEETKFAISSLLELIWADFDSLEKLKSQLKVLTADFEIKHQSFVANEFHPAANYYHAQMAIAQANISKPKAHLESQIQDISQRIDAKSASIASLSGAVLQVAKQCISLKYGKPQSAPDGCSIKGVLVKSIIWEGRNQAIHYESPKEISPKVVDLFAKLDGIRADGQVWDAKSKVNYAFDIVHLLGWRSYEDYETHLKSIKSNKGG